MTPEATALPGPDGSPAPDPKFDLAGRVYSGVPAPTNPAIPEHSYLSDSRIVTGVGGKIGGVA